MDIRQIAIGDLRPAPYNPRVALRPGDAGYERLSRSIDEFGLVQLPVWNVRTGQLVGGHQRVEVLRRRGAAKVECVVVDLPPERERALNVALNNPRVGGEWDADRLVAVLDELQALPDFDVTLTGFDEQQLRDLVLAPAEQGMDIESDAAAEADAARRVTVILEMEPAVWNRIASRVDAIVAEEPELEVHVRDGAADG